MSPPQQYATMQFALVAVNTVCALSFIKPVRRVFNLKLLPGSTKSAAPRHSPKNSSELDHALERNKINLAHVKRGRNTRGYRSWLRSPLVAGGLIN